MTKNPLIFQDAVEDMGFAMIYHIVTLDTRVTDGAYRLYALLLKFARNKRAWPGIARLAKDLGCSEPTIQRRLLNLINVGLITRERRFATSTLTWVMNLGDVYRDHPLILARIQETEEDIPPELIPLSRERSGGENKPLKNDGTVQNRLQEAIKIDRSVPSRMKDEEYPSKNNQRKKKRKKKKERLSVLWDSLLEELSLQLPPSAFNTWFRGSQPVKIDNGVMSIAVRTQQQVQLLNTRYVQMIMRTLKEKLASTEEKFEIDSVEFVIAPKT